MKPRHLLLGASVVVAGWLAVYGDKSPSGGVAEPLTRGVRVARPSVPAREHAEPAMVPKDASSPVTANARDSAGVKPKQEIVIRTLRPRTDLIGGTYAGRRADGLFGTHSWVQAPPPQAVLPPAPPTAPPMPFTYLGKKIEDAKWEVYLARGEQTYIVREQSMLEDSYRVDAIKPPTMTLTYLPLKEVQSIAIGGIE